MTKINEKINFIDSSGKVVSFSDFSLTQINYTFDIWTPGGGYNEFCLRKDELIGMYKFFRSFIQGDNIAGLLISDYDSPSTIEIAIKEEKEVSLILKLTYPSYTEVCLVLNTECLKSVQVSLEKVILTVDDKEYEVKMSAEYGFDFTY